MGLFRGIIIRCLRGNLKKNGIYSLLMGASYNVSTIAYHAIYPGYIPGASINIY